MSEVNGSLLSLFQIGNSIHNLNKMTERLWGLSLVQWCLLKHLIDMPATSANRLSKAVQVHPSTLTQTLKRLEKKKFIFMIEDPNDSRKKLISITRLGRDVLAKSSFKIQDLSAGLAIVKEELHQVHSWLKMQFEDGSLFKVD